MYRLKKMTKFFLLLGILITLIKCNCQRLVELKNDDFGLILNITPQGIPVIEKGYWIKSGKTAFLNKTGQTKIEDWIPQNLALSGTSQISTWKIQSTNEFMRASAEKTLGMLKITWNVELLKKGSLFRMWVQMANVGKKDIAIEWFPIWAANWNLPSNTNRKLKYWQSIFYQPKVEKFKKDSTIILSSRVYSSDRDKSGGQLPYWQISGNKQSLFFSISWCGGWQAHISQGGEETQIKVVLPAEETQLTLKQGETIDGPILNVFANQDINPVISRSNWLSQREFLSSHLFKKPPNWYPLIYNHWYAVRFNLSGTFIKNQLSAMRPYNFDVFVIDAGWYNSVGDWTSNTHKFKQGEFESALKNVNDNGIKTGIWSCPWLLTIKNDQFLPEIDEPRYYNKFMNAYALDLLGADFEKRLNKHVSDLINQLHINWWKYDQEFFGKTSRNGKMKNIIVLQKALSNVRNSYPKLNIENCMSGGRMINEFTDEISQSHWIRDGGSNGLEHARTNIQDALGAIQFLSPAKVQRWINRPNEMDEENRELLKLYCRSAMIGVWGISSDLNKISEKQRKVILNEIDNYRKLNKIKISLKYEILYPEDNNDIAGVIFYNNNGSKAAVLLFRWDKKGTISKAIPLNLLKKATYNIINVDSNESVKQMVNSIYSFSLDVGQLSALYFLEKVD